MFRVLGLGRWDSGSSSFGVRAQYARAPKNLHPGTPDVRRDGP